MKIITTLFLLTSSITFAQNTTTTDPAAQETTSVAPIPATPMSTKREDIDEEVTNARLRASTGSKSLWSIQSAYNYNGGSVETPLSSKRPQLAQNTVENDPAKLTGSIAAKYRATDHDNLSAGFGAGWVTPTYQGQTAQIESPYMAYSRVFKLGPTQNVTTAQYTKYTAASSVKAGLNYEVEVDHNILLKIANSKWHIGSDFWISREFYMSSNGGLQDKYAVTPLIEYVFNDTLSFRTVYSGFTYYNSVAQPSVFLLNAAKESTGIGISVARDVYLYPNIQWIWTDLKPEKTNVALAAYVNLF